LLVFDFITHETILYWTFGSKFPHFNPFKDIHFMAYVQGNYEPIFTKNFPLELKTIQLIYAKILTDPTIKYFKEINLSPYTFVAINTFDVSRNHITNIFNTYLKLEPLPDFLKKE